MRSAKKPSDLTAFKAFQLEEAFVRSLLKKTEALSCDLAPPFLVYRLSGEYFLVQVAKALMIYALPFLVLEHDRVHLVFQGQFLLFQGDFF
jgi:hypothetical protein